MMLAQAMGGGDEAAGGGGGGMPGGMDLEIEDLNPPEPAPVRVQGEGWGGDWDYLVAPSGVTNSQAAL